MPMLDLLIHNATLPDGRRHMSVAVQDGRITEVTEGLRAPAHDSVDAGGLLLSPPFVDAHFHLDSALTYGQPPARHAPGRLAPRPPHRQQPGSHSATVAARSARPGQPAGKSRVARHTGTINTIAARAYPARARGTKP